MKMCTANNPSEDPKLGEQLLDEEWILFAQIQQLSAFGTPKFHLHILLPYMNTQIAILEAK